MIVIKLDISKQEEVQFARFLEHTLETLTNYEYSVTIKDR